jgi:hypothetical protein
MIPSSREGDIMKGFAILSAPNNDWFDYTWKATTPERDLSYIHKLIPEEVSEWVMDVPTGEISFFTDGELFKECTFIGPGPLEIYSADGQLLTLGKTGVVGNEGDAVVPNVYAFRARYQAGQLLDDGGDNNFYINYVHSVMWLVQKAE